MKSIRDCLALGLLLVAAMHCGSDAQTMTADRSETPPGVTDSDASSSSPRSPLVPHVCDDARLPTKDECVMHESVGVFVSSLHGSEHGDGSRERPMLDLNAALRAAQLTGRRVYACAEIYAAQLTLVEGVMLFGYFDCDRGWRIGSRRALISPKLNIAARAQGVRKPTRIEGVEIVGADAQFAGQSSIGMIAEDSPGLYFFNVAIRSGVGGHGVDGVDALQLVQSGSIHGRDGSALGYERFAHKYPLEPRPDLTSRVGGISACGGSPAQNGGAGGTGAAGDIGTCTGLFGRGPIFGALCIGFAQDGKGECWIGGTALGSPEVATVETASSGEPGAAGLRGSDGTTPIAVIGVSGVAAADGTGASNGSPGQGGGGGSSELSVSSVSCHGPRQFFATTGSGGGAGGCPGLAGTPGTGGGASIAVIALQSPMSFDALCEVRSAAAGRGGRAGASSLPTSGGQPGTTPGAATRGGAGGAGGAAGSSGHGASGDSIGIAFTGDKPYLEVPAEAGAAGEAPPAALGQRKGRAGRSLATLHL